jgi:hypothetical protein
VRVCLPDMSGPPTFYDGVVLLGMVVSVVAVVRRVVRRRG